MKSRPVWQIGVFDQHGRWGADSVDLEQFWSELYKKLSSYESMTWGQIEIDRKRNHSVAVASVTKEARDRLSHLNLDDVDQLYRFRFDGTSRLWGIRDRELFKLLWWDPNHEICPSNKKHT